MICLLLGDVNNASGVTKITMSLKIYYHVATM